jgi:hypothetical protein
MASVKQHRPDLDITVNDLYRSKCKWAESRYGFRTICGSAGKLSVCHERFDVVTAIDVLYYEGNISQLWAAFALLLKPRGTLILRLPNNLPAILFHQLVLSALTTSHDRQMRTKIRHFNPEHLYVFSRKYLKNRLTALGFRSVKVLPSALLVTEERFERFFRLYHGVAKVVCSLSAGRTVITPGMLVVASMGPRG